MSWYYLLFQSDFFFFHKQKASRFNIKPKPFQVSLSGYLRHKDFADCCVSKSLLSVYFSIIFKALQSEKWSQTTLQVPQGENLNMGRSWQAAGSIVLLRWCERQRRHKCSCSLYVVMVTHRPTVLCAWLCFCGLPETFIFKWEQWKT